MTCRGARHHACPSHIGRRDDDDVATAAPRPPSLTRDDKAPSCPRPPVTFTLTLTFIDESVTTWRCDPRPHPRRDDAAPMTTAMGALSHSRMAHQCIGKVVETSPEWFRTIVLIEQLPRTLFCLFGSPSSNHSSGMTTKESSSGNVITWFPDDHRPRLDATT